MPNIPTPQTQLSCPQPPDLGRSMTPVEAALNETEGLLDELSAKVDTLTVRLNTVLADAPPEATAAQGGADRFGSSPVSSAIAERNETIERLVHKIQRLIERLEC